MGYIEYQTNSRYVQSENALSEIRRYTHGMGKNFLIVTACSVITDKVVKTVTDSFESSMESKCDPSFSATNPKYAANIALAKKYDAQNIDINYSFVDFEGRQTTVNNIAELVAIAKERETDVIIGIGGGKVLDIVRGVSHQHPCKVVLCPTSLSTNASGSGLTIVYNDEGLIVDMLTMPTLPDLVLVDLSILIETPPIMLVSGLGDAVASATEAISCANAFGRRNYLPDTAWYATENIVKAVMDNGRAAIEASKKKEINHAYESVVPCILNACGSVRSFRISFIPHLFDEVLLNFEGAHKLPHGFRVGYCVLPQMIFDHRPLADIHEYLDFCTDIGLPVNFEQLGMPNPDLDELYKYTKIMMEGTACKVAGYPFIPEDFVYNALKNEKIVADYFRDKK